MECPLCYQEFEPVEDQILLMADGEPNICWGIETYVCRDCYEIHGDGE